VIVHSQTLPIMSTSPYPFGGKVPTGEVPTRALGDRDAAGGFGEVSELGIGHRVPLDGEGTDGRGVDRRFFGIEAGRPHPERPAGQRDELGEHGLRV
jgi:hypothetical protein